MDGSHGLCAVCSVGLGQCSVSGSVVEDMDDRAHRISFWQPSSSPCANDRSREAPQRDLSSVGANRTVRAAECQLLPESLEWSWNSTVRQQEPDGSYIFLPTKSNNWQLWVPSAGRTHTQCVPEACRSCPFYCHMGHWRVCMLQVGACGPSRLSRKQACLLLQCKHLMFVGMVPSQQPHMHRISPMLQPDYPEVSLAARLVVTRLSRAGDSIIRNLALAVANLTTDPDAEELAVERHADMVFQTGCNTTITFLWRPFLANVTQTFATWPSLGHQAPNHIVTGVSLWDVLHITDTHQHAADAADFVEVLEPLLQVCPRVLRRRPHAVLCMQRSSSAAAGQNHGVPVAT